MTKKANNKSSLGEKLEKILKSKSGRVSIHRASECTPPWSIKRCPTGIARLDIATGGGLPTGGATILRGKEGVGKTHLSIRTASNMQRKWGKDFKMFYAGSEIPLDKVWAKTHGNLMVAVSDKQLKVIQDRRKSLGLKNWKLTEEEVGYLKKNDGEIIEVYSKDGEYLLETIIDLIETREFQIGIVDSMGSIMHSFESDAGLSDKLYGGNSVPNTRFSKHIHRLFRDEDEDTALILIDQARAEMNAQSYGGKPALHAGGGFALGHMKLLDIEMWKGGKIVEPNSSITIGRKMKWEIVKGKCGCAEGSKGIINYLTSIGFDELEDLIEVCDENRYFDKSGSWFTLNNEKGEQVFKIQGKVKLKDFLLENPEVVKGLWNRLKLDNKIFMLEKW